MAPKYTPQEQNIHRLYYLINEALILQNVLSYMSSEIVCMVQARVSFSYESAQETMISVVERYVHV